MTNGRVLEPDLLAAIMAAVQAYRDDDEADALERRPARLSPWKMAAWQPLRGRMHGLDMGWRRAGQDSCII